MAEPYTYARTIDDLAGIDTGPLEFGDPRYVDLAEARGDDPIPGIVRRIALADRVSPVPVLLTGHRGSGRTTELRRLAGDLRREGFEVVFVDAQRALGDGGVAELVVALLEQVARATAGRDWGEAEPIRFDMLARVRAAPAEAWTPITFAENLQLIPRRSQVIDWATEALSIATRLLRREGGRGLVLLVDNLDRLPYDRLRALLTGGGRTLAGFKVPIVLSAPASLATESELHGIYAVEALRPLGPPPSGLRDYEAVLDRRCDRALFGVATLPLLAASCGGNIHALIRTVAEAAVQTRHTLVDERSVTVVLARASSDLHRLCVETDLNELARLEVSRGRVGNDFVHLLDWGAALSFGREDVVHPLVRATKRFRQRVAGQGSSARTPSDESSTELPPTSVVLTGFDIRDFRGITSLSVSLPTESKLPGSWLCIAGVNGAGKSAALQAISLALLGDELARELGRERLARMVRRSESDAPVEAASISLRLRFDDEPEEVELCLDQRGVSGGSDDGQLLRMRRTWRRRERYPVLSYGANRSLSDYPDTRHVELALDVRRQMTLFDPLAQVANVDVLLREGRPLAGAVPLFEKLVKAVFPDFSMVVEPGRGVQFMLTERPAVEAVDLPDGFRATLAWLADLCAAWLEKVGPLTQDPETSDIRAIVLIDEIDLHLHPSLQRTLVPRLRAALPGVQWIVTTHSPLILSCFDRSEIVLLDHRAPDGVRVPDRQILGFTMDQIYRWLMDTQPQGGAITELLERADPSGAGVSEQEQQELALLTELSPEVSEEQARARIDQRMRRLASLRASRPAKG